VAEEVRQEVPAHLANLAVLALVEELHRLVHIKQLRAELYQHRARLRVLI
jgi:hypothetical protein